MKHRPSFSSDHPHLRSEPGWELCDAAAPCPHAVAERALRRYRRGAALAACGTVAFASACAASISLSIGWLAGTFMLSAAFAALGFAGLCEQRYLSDIPVADADPR